MFWKKLSQRRIWRRIFMERLPEPLHLNLMSLVVAMFGTFRVRVLFDLVVRQHNAFGILKAAEMARHNQIQSIWVVEFGVAAGAGLMNMSSIARRVERATGVRVRIVGFDSGAGMPAAVDYRDHPEYYQEGDFQMDIGKLRAALPAGVELVLGDVADTVPAFTETIDPACPIGYVVLDVDYYSSTVSALKIFEGAPDQYLPVTLVYLDDVAFEGHNTWSGEQLAIGEFNEAHDLRKFEPHRFLEDERVFRRAPWIKKMYYLHVMDHPGRAGATPQRPGQDLDNPYL